VRWRGKDELGSEEQEERRPCGGHWQE
jgi:hypothetical protein